MAAESKPLPENLIEDCKRVGISTLQNWLDENEIELPRNKENNFFSSIEEAINSDVLTIQKLYQGIAEIEENSNKKIYLYQVDDIDEFKNNLQNTLKRLKREFGYTPSEVNFVSGNANARPTFIYMYVDDDQLKIKFSEIHYNMEADYERQVFDKTPLIVAILFVIDFTTGIVQLRIDNPGNIHSHKNDEKKSTESAFENYYKDLLAELFPDRQFSDLNLNGVANYIAASEKEKFRINRGVTTITNNAKQTFASASTRQDVRDLPEYEAAEMKGGKVWRTEDLTGYWLANKSNGELKKDLFMRISRKLSMIRVQRGCLEKELSYGIKQIREIQEKV